MQRIEIRIKGQISQRWSGWFEGLTISHPCQEETSISGVVQDEFALYGIISRLRDLGLQLTSLTSAEIQEGRDERNEKDLCC